MEKETMKIVFVGHVDHGKSTLIGRLMHDTGSLPDGKVEEIRKVCEQLGREFEYGFILDHLQEEREQMITIETTQIFFKTGKRDYVIIDAPGHKEFLKNMITGASQAEAAILIISAEEGIQEQTKRHAYILSLLGMKQIIAAVNKMDLAGYEEKKFNSIKQELQKFLKSINVNADYIIPISAKQGCNVASRSKNIPWYKGKTVLEALDAFSIRKAEENAALRFPVQDVYFIDGKRIYVGRVESGSISQGDAVILLPSGKESKIKSIEKFLDKPAKASVGECIGITLADPWFVERGEIICKKDSLPKVSDEINARVFWMAKEPFGRNEKIIMKCTTQEIPCRLQEISRKFDSSSLQLLAENAPRLNETEVAEVVIKTDKPVAVDDFNDIRETGRFVFERNLNTVAGGIISLRK